MRNKDHGKCLRVFFTAKDVRPDNCTIQFIDLFKTPCWILHNVYKYYEEVRCNDDAVIVADDIVLYCGRVPAANAPGCTAAEGLLYKP